MFSHNQLYNSHLFTSTVFSQSIPPVPPAPLLPSKYVLLIINLHQNSNSPTDLFTIHHHLYEIISRLYYYSAVFVSYQATEVILCLDFLERCMCDFRNRAIYADGQTYLLFAKTDERNKMKLRKLLISSDHESQPPPLPGLALSQ